MADDGYWPAGGASLPVRVSYSDEVGQAICARLAAGESLMAVCREAAMPHRTTVREWAQRHPAFGEALLAAARGARLRKRRADLARAMRPRDPRGRWLTYSHEVGAAICRRLSGGETLIAICRDEAMPCYATVLNWARAVPEFAEAYAEARRLAADYLFDEAREVALAATPGSVWVDRLRFDVIRWQAARIAPRKYLEPVVARETRLALERERAAALRAEVEAEWGADEAAWAEDED